MPRAEAGFVGLGGVAPFAIMFERYTESARRTLFFARYESSQQGSRAIETEHLLLGLVRQSKGLVGRIFSASHVPAESLRRQVEARMVFREKIPTSVEIPFSDEVKRVLHFTAEEADRMRHTYIGTEHLLLGLLREERSLAGSILAESGLRLENIRELVVKLLNESPRPISGRQPELAGALDQIQARVDQLAQIAERGEKADALVAGIRSLIERLKQQAE